jgi:hypothetical protein
VSTGPIKRGPTSLPSATTKPRSAARSTCRCRSTSTFWTGRL